MRGTVAKRLRKQVAEYIDAELENPLAMTNFGVKTLDSLQEGGLAVARITLHYKPDSLHTAIKRAKLQHVGRTLSLSDWKTIKKLGYNHDDPR